MSQKGTIQYKCDKNTQGSLLISIATKCELFQFYNKNNKMQYQTFHSDFIPNHSIGNNRNQNQFYRQEDVLLNRRKSNMINHLLDTIEYQSNSKNQIRKQLFLADKQFQTMYASTISSSPNKTVTLRDQIKRQLNSQAQNSRHKLKMPKPNTLTDKFLKLSLGCQGYLIQSYNGISNPQHNSVKQQKCEDRTKLAKQYFLSQKNQAERLEQQKQGKHRKHTNFFINSGNDHPFYDEDYLKYQKTNMIYLQNVKQDNKLNNKRIEIEGDQSKLQQKKKALKIIEKLKETGGIQDTIKIMERSLHKNQIKHSRKNQYIKSPNKNNFQKVQFAERQKRHKQQKLQAHHHKYKSSLTTKQSSVQKSRNRRSESTVNISKRQKEIIYDQIEYSSKMTNISSWMQRSKSLREKFQKDLAIK